MRVDDAPPVGGRGPKELGAGVSRWREKELAPWSTSSELAIRASMRVISVLAFVLGAIKQEIVLRRSDGCNEL